MASAGELVEFLSCFDQHLSVQILAVSGSDSSEVVSIVAMNSIDPTVTCAADFPTAIWLVAQHRASSDTTVVPAVIGLTRQPCGCPLRVPVVLDRPVATWAIECEHSPSVPS